MGWEPKVVAAIDVGAHGCGFAWTVNSPPNDEPLTRDIHFLTSYPGLPAASGPLPAADLGRVRRLITCYLDEIRMAALADIAATAACTAAEIRWCITIPASWDEPAKFAVRQAAYDAGFPAEEDRLLLSIEPEAAALYCQLRLTELAPDADVARFIVVTCTDGMVEATGYESARDVGRLSRLEEVGLAAAGPLGSTDLTALFEHGNEIVVIVGDHAASVRLASELGRRLGGGHQVFVPPDPALAILEGAVHYTYDPLAIASRRSKYTYGFAVAMPWEAGIDSPDRMFCDEDHVMMCGGRFAVAVHRMDRVAVDEPVTFLVEPAFTDSPEVTVQLYRTRAADPRFVDEEGCEPAGSLTVDVRDTVGRTERPIALLLYFGRSQIQVEAIDLITDKKFGTVTDFAQML